MTGAERGWRHLRTPAAQRGFEGTPPGRPNVGGTTKYEFFMLSSHAVGWEHLF